MKTRPIEPARIEFGAEPGTPPGAADSGDGYRPGAGALAQARHVFVQGNGLPARWAARPHFVILETGFGLGHNFLATWDAWRHDPARCAQLHFVSLERHPPSGADLARAHENSPLPELSAELLRAWPPLTPNLHLLDFEQGHVRLTLALGDVGQLLPALRLSADAIYLDGFAPQRNPQLGTPQVIKAVGRRAAAGATAATCSVARDWHDSLASAGFEPRCAAGIGGQHEITLARWAPRFSTRRLPPLAVPSTDAIVVGAGLAGAAAAQALARLGLKVTVLERETAPAQAASGNPAGLFHGSVHAQDGPYARLYRAAALAAATEYRDAIGRGAVDGQINGLLRLQTSAEDEAGLPAQLLRQGLPPAYVQALSADAASQQAGVALQHGCAFYPAGGWIAPPQWVRHALRTPGVDFRGGCAAQTLERDGESWRVLDEAGRVLARSTLLVLANAADAARLLAPLGHAPWPLSQSRGQVTYWDLAEPSALALPLAGDGYVLPLPGGLLCGATRQDNDEGPELRSADHQRNMERLQRLCGLQAPGDPQALRGRVGWRLHTDDRLPIAGALPQARLHPTQRKDQARLLPREPGLFVLTALGARGLTLAPLLGRLVAAQATGTPWPLEQDLADAVDPARWVVRAARRQPS